MNSHTLIDAMLVIAAQAIIPYKNDIEDQTDIVNEVSSLRDFFFFGTCMMHKTKLKI